MRVLIFLHRRNQSSRRRDLERHRGFGIRLCHGAIRYLVDICRSANVVVDALYTQTNTQRTQGMCLWNEMDMREYVGSSCVY